MPSRGSTGVGILGGKIGGKNPDMADYFLNPGITNLVSHSDKVLNKICRLCHCLFIQSLIQPKNEHNSWLEDKGFFFQIGHLLMLRNRLESLLCT